MMLLAGAFGSTVRVETDGPDESAAMTAIVGLLREGLGAPA
jgi:phosphotransferase system HPr-like phosphotransfer protein